MSPRSMFLTGTPRWRVTGPPIDVVLPEFHRQTARAVRAGGLIRHSYDGKRRVARRERVTGPQAALGHLDQAQQATGPVKLVSRHALNDWLTLDPRHRMNA